MAQAHGGRRARTEQDPPVPEGLKYRPAILSRDEEQELVGRLSELPVREFEFHGYFGKRRTLSFGWEYDFTGRELRKTAEIPSFLLGLRESAARLAGAAPSEFQHALVTEYPAGAGLGWHKDKAVFGQVVGISLLSACTLRFRRRNEAGWDRWSLSAEPRSAYVLTGPSRTEWEHSIPAVRSLRYSVTFRTLRSIG